MPYGRFNGYAKGVKTMSKAWRPCQRHGGHGNQAEGMVTKQSDGSRDKDMVAIEEV